MKNYNNNNENNIYNTDNKIPIINDKNDDQLKQLSATVTYAIE